MVRSRNLILLFIFSLFVVALPSNSASVETARVHVTVLTASNQGADFNLENDAFRDQLLTLFTYSSYNQMDKFFVDLRKGERQYMNLPGGYELILTLQSKDAGRVYVQAIIRKESQQFVDTVLSIMSPGVVFLGGPPVDQGVLILVLETGY